MITPPPALAMRKIDASSHRAPDTPFDPGAAPMLQWLKIDDLVVDDSYQRPIRGNGAKNVAKIAEGFCWSKFAPIIVSPVAGGKYAVIDGQHRTTAAALRGVELLPAQVIIADQVEQASAFKAINSQITRMNALELHRAAVAGGDLEAIEVNALCANAGVTIVRRAVDIKHIKPGETLAIGAIRTQMKRTVHSNLIIALKCVTQSRNNIPGCLSANIIEGLCAVVSVRALRSDPKKLYAVFDHINIMREDNKARFTPRAKGVGAWEVLRDRLDARIDEVLAKYPDIGQEAA